MRQKITFAMLITFSAMAHAEATNPDTVNALQEQVNALENQINDLQNPQTALPSVGISSNYSSIIAEHPNTSYALAIEQMKQQLPALLTFGGKFQVDSQFWGGTFSRTLDNGQTYQSGSATNPTDFRFYTFANMNEWVTGLFTLLSDIPLNNVHFEQAVLDMGNLTRTPFFLTAGKTYIPFGVFYGAGPWSDNLDILNFRNNTTDLVAFNYAQGGLYTAISVFNNSFNHAANVNDFSYTLNYRGKAATLNYLLSAGYLYDVRGTSTGLGSAYVNEGNGTITGERNPVYDLNGMLQYRKMMLSAEIDMTANSADNLNGSATGRMNAWNVTDAYSTVLRNIPTTFSVGYSQTQNMNNVPMFLSGAINEPTFTQNSDNNAGMSHQWLTYMSNEFFKNVYMSPEYVYATLYNGQNTWAFTYDITAYF